MKKAFTLTELMLVLGLFGLMISLVFTILNQGFGRWRETNAKFDAEQKLSKALSWLQRDLEEADPDQVGTARVGVAGNGDAVWFLSAVDPNQTNRDLRFIRDPATGLPVAQRNVLYYLIRPSDYSQVSGGLSAGIDGDPRNDYLAAHKLLIRKVINRPGAPEKLLSASEAATFMTAPVTANVNSLAGEAQVESCRLVADRLLSFEADRSDTTIDLTLRAVHIERAQKALSLGSVSLKESPYTEVGRLRVVMKR